MATQYQDLYGPNPAYRGEPTGYPSGYTTSSAPRSSSALVKLGVVVAVLAIAAVVVYVLVTMDSGGGDKTDPNSGLGSEDCPNECQHGGQCVKGVCKCATGYTGTACEKQQGGGQSECPTECQHGGSCVNGECECAAGYVGDSCEEEEEQGGNTDTNVTTQACASSPCRHGGSCTDSKRNNRAVFTCQCTEEYQGTTCAQQKTPEDDVCASITCAHDGSCVDDGGKAVCECADGYRGDRCQTATNPPTTAPCASSPCKNGATCTASATSFTCRCATGYTGATCTQQQQPLPCASSPCKNGASCTNNNAGSSFTCRCASGYSGPNCQTKTDGCASSPCQNGGTCSSSASGITCRCPDTHNGPLCQTKIPTGGNPTGPSYTATSRGNIQGGGAGYKYELWKSDTTGGTVTMQLYNDAARFRVQWSLSSYGFVARCGLGFDETKTIEQLGNITANFAFTKTGNGKAYMGLYGWTVDPLMEYYVVEDWNQWRPTFTLKTTITVDGEQYDVHTNTQTNQPSIKGTATFPQIYSVHKSGRRSGVMSVSEHFAQWKKLGLQAGGKLYEAMLLVEGMAGSGTVDWPVATVTRS